MIKQYLNLIIAVVLIAIVVGVYFKGRHDGASSAKINAYQAEIKAYEDARDRSLKLYEDASKQQKLDFESALKASEERQTQRLESIERAGNLQTALIKQQTALKNCVLDKQTLEILNESLRGKKK